MGDNAANIAAAGQGVVNAALGYMSTKEQSKANAQNYEIALKNLGLSEEQMKYMRALQERMFERDDNAITRMVKDLENNGFNKLLAFGTSGLSNTTVSQPSAPQMEYRYQPIDYSALKQNLVGTVADLENLKNIRTQRELMETQQYGQTLNNILTEVKAKENAYNLDYYSSKGLPTNATGLPKIGAEVEGIINNKKDSVQSFVNNLIENAKEKKEQKDKIKAKEKRDKYYENQAKSSPFERFVNKIKGKPNTTINKNGFSRTSGSF